MQRLCVQDIIHLAQVRRHLLHLLDTLSTDY